MRRTRRVGLAHGVALLLGLLYLGWVAFPLGAGDWRIDPTIHWGYLVNVTMGAGVLGGVLQGVGAGFGRIWPALVPLVPASLVALWACALFVAPSLFGSTPAQPEPSVFVAAVTGWVLYVALSLVVTVGVASAVAALLALSRDRRTERAATVGGAARGRE